MLTSILELGAWVGTLANGYLADALGRRLTVLVAVVVFCIGVIVQACTANPDFVFGGRFVTGLGVGSLSMVVPLYNAELVSVNTHRQYQADRRRHHRKFEDPSSPSNNSPSRSASWSASGYVIHPQFPNSPDIPRSDTERIILVELAIHNRMLHGWFQSVFKFYRLLFSPWA
jgi:hypothetical protein